MMRHFLIALVLAAGAYACATNSCCDSAAGEVPMVGPEDCTVEVIA